MIGCFVGIYLRKLGIAILLLLCIAMLVLSAQAGGTYTLGDQDASDGSDPLSSPPYTLPSVGEPAPFDLFNGADNDGPNFDATWTHTFPTDGTIISGTLEFGIWDHDSAAAGDQVATFTVDGVDRTTDANTAFNSKGGSQLEYNTYSFSVNPALLTDGQLVVRLELQAPGLGRLATGEVYDTDYNGAWIDFSRLIIVQEEGPPENGVPELEWSLPIVISLVAAALFIAKKRLIKAP